jgi:DNA-binding response OmpR family regulator
MEIPRDTAILVVDDEPLVRTFVARVLENEGYRVVVAGDGREALQLIDAALEPFALIVTDERMPRLEGPALAAAVRARYPGQRFLRIVGDPPEDDAPGANAWERMPWIGKPFQPTQLVERVRAVIAGAGGAE